MPTITDTLLIPTGEIAIRSPGASRVFHRYHIDYCCGGKKPLGESCAAAGVDPEAVLHELAEAETLPLPAAIRWDLAPLNDLIDHLLVKFHQPLKEELPRLRFMAMKVARVHGGHQPAMFELGPIVDAMATELEAHLAKEEDILFPWIRSGQGASAGAPITTLHHEHDAHGRHLAQIRQLCDGFVPWAGACGTVRALYLGLEALERDLMEHIHLENNVLFPRALGADRNDQPMKG